MPLDGVESPWIRSEKPCNVLINQLWIVNMNMTSLLIKQARIIKTRKGKYEYARLVIHDSKDLLKYVGREVTVMIIIKDEDGGNGNENKN